MNQPNTELPVKSSYRAVLYILGIAGTLQTLFLFSKLNPETATPYALLAFAPWLAFYFVNNRAPEKKER